MTAGPAATIKKVLNVPLPAARNGSKTASAAPRDQQAAIEERGHEIDEAGKQCKQPWLTRAPATRALFMSETVQRGAIFALSLALPRSGCGPSSPGGSQTGLPALSLRTRSTAQSSCCATASFKPMWPRAFARINRGLHHRYSDSASRLDC